MELVLVPPGLLIMGDDLIKDASPQHELSIHPFHIGKFPVTNTEYAEFVAAGGYDAREHWSEMGWKWLQSRGPRAPAFWTDAQFNAPCQPVVGVSWYEAVAFCNWVSENGGREKTGGRAGGTFRLPSEAEWEYAARGANNTRNFPWGDHFERGHANTAEAGFSATTPVDYFPAGASPFDVWDLSGNVFEWTLTKWGMNWQELQFYYPYRAEDGREEIEGSGARVMRGGSWFNPYYEARCAFRSRYLAGSRGSSIGFRIAQVDF